MIQLAIKLIELNVSW